MEEKLLAKERMINRLHLIYGFIILAILCVCLLVVVPGHINEDAFDNFCFAATIVSIVLAVVSIVYSFRTKNNASDNMAGIREIERGIDEKLRRFDELEKNILAGLDSKLQSGIDPIHQDVSSLRDDQVGMRESLEQLKEELRQQSASISAGKKKEESKTRFQTNSLLGDLALYIACLSSKTQKAIDLDQIDERLAKRSQYLFGYLIAILVSFPDKISANVEKGKTVINSTFNKFDTELFGDEEVCKQRILRYKDNNTAKEYVSAIDKYFGIQ